MSQIDRSRWARKPVEVDAGAPAVLLRRALSLATAAVAAVPEAQRPEADDSVQQWAAKQAVKARRKERTARWFMPGRGNYRYYLGGKDGKGRRVWFCYSLHRNLAGYYLSWRLVVGKSRSRYDRTVAFKHKKPAIRVAQRRALAFKQAQAKRRALTR